tara:strand:- start:5436 stop:5810 length:375 start_codon:yes stop_codon:yes gene_type:complete
MARLEGVDLPKNKRILIALTYIHGVGPVLSRQILDKLKIDINTRTKDLTEKNIVDLRAEIQSIITEGDLRRVVSQNIRRLKEIGAYRGQRHAKNLPARGQRTHTNARTKRGKKIAIAGKKKVTK